MYLFIRPHFLSFGAVMPAALSASLFFFHKASQSSPILLSCCSIERPMRLRKSAGVLISSADQYVSGHNNPRPSFCQVSLPLGGGIDLSNAATLDVV